MHISLAINLQHSTKHSLAIVCNYFNAHNVHIGMFCHLFSVYYKYIMLMSTFSRIVYYVIQHVHNVFTVSKEVPLTPTICTIPLAIIFTCGALFLAFLLSLKGQHLISVALLLCAIMAVRGSDTFSSHVTRHIGWVPCHLILDGPTIPTVCIPTLIH